MSDSIYARVRRNPNYQVLVRRRGRLAVVLSALVLVSYYSFMMVVAFAPGLLGRPLGEGATLSVGVPIGAGIIVVSWLLTGVYSYFANGPFDDLTNDLIRETAE
ncbi:DUF485 domain-containing protein (plasmid) [Skermanella sp. TT6]|uniref:DUF485 domain-containing protein n=1 Tax=Skermanella cutis TaxID=2775420 RepID=A0ABX7BGM1_9PROT|nr:DUF485 domain-containing protein [Skermanella sp. TT6]QQP93533.1 DUF485 domain-containing protein [Skermanella sp. TT6]